MSNKLCIINKKLIQCHLAGKRTRYNGLFLNGSHFDILWKVREHKNMVFSCFRIDQASNPIKRLVKDMHPA